MRWFRFYDEALNDPKILKLSDNLYRIWVGLLCVASKNEGQLPPLDDLCLMIRIKPEKMQAALESLIKSGLIDDDGVVLSPHNWNGRQYKSDSSNERVKRYRERQCNVTVTPPDTEQIQKQKDTRVALVFESDWPKDFREAFWELYPRRVDKQLAFKKLEQLRRGGELSWGTLIAGVERYAQSVRGQDPKYTKGPAAWLNAGKWDDEVQEKTKPVFDVRAHLV